MPFVNQETFEEVRRHQQITKYEIYPLQSEDVEDYQVLAENIPSLISEDIRILQKNAKIPFWAEEKGKAWSKIAKLMAKTPQQLFALSGNPSASLASNGDNIFEFFDDFDYINEPLYPFALGSEAIRGFPRPGVDTYNGGILPVDYIGRIEHPAKQWKYDAGSNVNTVLVEDVDGDGKLEVIAFVHSTPNKVICVKWDGSGTKWEHALPAGEEFHDNAGMCGIIDDIYNDGTKEIVFYTFINHEVNGYIRCLNASTGGEEWNYYCNKGVETVGSDPNGMQVADIDGDGKKEIIVLLDIPGELLCLEHDGTFKWSKVEDGEDEYGAAVGDIDGDSNLEIVHGTEQNGLRIRNVSGVIETTYANPSGVYTSAVPSIKDVDSDGKLEILAGFDDLGDGVGKSLVMLEHDCTEKWSKSNLGGFDASSFILGDIDGDSVDEAVVINHGPVGVDMIMRCYNATNGVEKWTYNFGNIAGRYIVGSPLAVDIDNDGELEILFLCRLDGKMYCISNTGTKKWSISVTAATPATRNTLVFSVADMNRNGYSDIVVGSTTGIITCIVPGTGVPEMEDRWTSTSNAAHSSEEAYEGTYSAKLCLSAGVYGNLIKTWTTSPIILEWASKLHSAGEVNRVFWGGNRNGGNYLIGMGESNTYAQVYDGVTHDTNVLKDYEWHTYKIVFSATDVKYYIDGILKYTTESTPSLTEWRFYGGHGISYHDIVRVRKYASPEPLMLQKQISGKADAIRAVVS